MMPRFRVAGLFLAGLLVGARAFAVADGDYDPTWTGAGRFTFQGEYTNNSSGSDAWIVNTEVNGNLFLAGNSYHIVTGGGLGSRWWLGELSPDGQFVPTFGAADGNGRITSCQLGFACPGDDSLFLEDALAQPDGKYLAVLDNYSLIRTTAGAHALDAAGTASGTGTVSYQSLQINDVQGYLRKVKSIALQPDGKLLLAGIGLLGPDLPTDRFGVLRLNGDLSLDPTFAAYTNDVKVTFSGGNVIAVDALDAAERASVVLVQPDGHIILVGIGSHDPAGLSPHLELARVGADGLVDQAYGSGGTVVLTWLGGSLGFNSPISAVLDSAGRVVIATNNADRSGAVVGRVTSAGLPDADFGIAGFEYIDKSLFVPTCDYVDTHAVAIDSAGRILVAGDCVLHNTVEYYFSIFRLRGTDAVIDPAFGVSGFSYGTFDSTSQFDQAFGLALDGGGRPVLVGPSDPSGNAAGIARLTYDLAFSNGFEAAPRGCVPPGCN
jgi:uncharacterized delta-60 repeat protein